MASQSDEFDSRTSAIENLHSLDNQAGSSKRDAITLDEEEDFAEPQPRKRQRQVGPETEPNSWVVKISNLSKKTGARKLRMLLKNCKIQSIRFKGDSISANGTESQRWAMVYLSSHEDVQKAIKKVSGQTVGKHKLAIKFVEGPIKDPRLYMLHDSKTASPMQDNSQDESDQDESNQDESDQDGSDQDGAGMEEIDLEEAKRMREFYPVTCKTGIWCWNCIKEGHQSKNCPNNKCTTCGETTHFAAACPLNQVCERCYLKGHKESDCAEKLRSTEAPPCEHCGSIKHLSHRCYSLWNTYVPPANPKKIKDMIVSCYKCGGQGHFGGDCALRSRNKEFQHGNYFSMANAAQYMDGPIPAPNLTPPPVDAKKARCDAFNLLADIFPALYNGDDNDFNNLGRKRSGAAGSIGSRISNLSDTLESQTFKDPAPGERMEEGHKYQGGEVPGRGSRSINFDNGTGGTHNGGGGGGKGRRGGVNIGRVGKMTYNQSRGGGAGGNSRRGNDRRRGGPRF